MRYAKRCKNCGDFLIPEGKQVLQSGKGIEGKLLGTGGKAEWMGEKLFAVWRCRRCGQIWLDEAKHL